MFIDNIDERYKPRIFELLNLNIDLIKNIKKNGLNRNNFKKLISNLQDSGPVVIKLIQWISNNSFSLNYIFNNKNNIDLSKLNILQDNCKERDVNIIIKKLSHSLSNFDINLFNKKPVGVGSIAQVHKYGDNIIKINHSNIHEIIKIDLEILKIILNEDLKNDLFNTNDLNFIKFLKILNIDKISKELIDQTNLINEANNILLFNEKIKLKYIFFPQIIFKSKNILIETFIEGQKVNSFIEKKNTYIKIKLNLGVLLFEMIYQGIIHGDLHDGNILCDSKSNIYLLDFGFIKYLNQDEILKSKKIIILLRKLLNNTKKEYIESILLLFCPEIKLEYLNNLSKKINNNLNEEKKYFTINEFKKLIDAINFYCINNNLVLNHNIVYVFLTYISIESNISQKFKINFLEQIFLKIKERNLNHLLFNDLD